MQLSEMRTQLRRYTHTNETNYPDADANADLNRSNGEVNMLVIEAEGYKNIGGDFKVIDHEDTSSLVEGDLGYNGEYPFPTEALFIEEAHIKYDADDDYYKAQIIDKSEVGSEMFNDNGLYDETSPKIFIFRDSYFIRPLLTDDTVTDGIKLLIKKRQTTLSGDADTPSFESNFHNLVPLKASLDYSLVYPEKYNPRIEQKVRELESKVVSYYQDRTPVETRFQPASADRGLKNW